MEGQRYDVYATHANIYDLILLNQQLIFVDKNFGELVLLKIYNSFGNFQHNQIAQELN